jgi:nucleoside-diphosphate-sugar epimerase
MMPEGGAVAKPPRRILVAGCGYVGLPLALNLAGEGHTVWGLRREAQDLPAPVRPLSADLTNEGSLDVLPAEVDDLVFCPSAGGRGSAARYRAIYAEGLQRLLDRMAPRRLIFVSSTGVFGQRHGEWVDEGSEPDPALVSGQCMLEAERVAATCDGAVVVRFSGIYGPGRIRLIRRLRAGDAVCVRDRPRYLNQIHRDDCAGVIRHVLELEDPAPVYLATDHEPASKFEVWQWLAARLGIPGPRQVDSGDPDLPRDERGNKRCSNRRLRDSGYSFRFPDYRYGYAGLLTSQAEPSESGE